MYGFGVDIGGTTVKMGLFTENGDLSEKWEIPTRTRDEGREILPDIAASLKGHISSCGLKAREIRGVGVGVPAPVSGDGIVKGTANLGWGHKEVGRELRELTGLKVKVQNDANAAALGEMWKGSARGSTDLVMITLGTGIGGGIITQGHVLLGSEGAAGEIGHITVNYNESEHCGCGGRGCLEQYASATGIARLARKKIAELKKDGGHIATALPDAGDITAKDVFDAVKAGDKTACEIADEFGRYLGYALANVAAVVNPAVIVIGGGVSKAGDVILKFIEPYYRQRAVFSNKKTSFVIAKLGNDAGIYGAAKLIFSD